MFEEAISSDDEDDLNADTVQGCILTTRTSFANESFSLVLESLDEEDLFDTYPSRDDSFEIIELNHAIVMNDTPEIEDRIVDADAKDQPKYVVKTMQELKKRKDELIVIDQSFL